MGVLIRCCLVACWLVLIGVHVWRFVLPGIGVVERKDLGAGLAQQLDRTLTYDIVRTAASGNGKRIGSSELTVVRDDAGFRCDLRFELEGLPGLPMTPAGAGSSSLHITAVQKLDDRFRLTWLKAEGDVIGLPLTAEAQVDHRGLTGTLRLAGTEHPFSLPGFDREDGAAMDLGVTLPPGLKPGDTFKAKMLDVGITLTPIERESIFTATHREPVLTRGGILNLLQVVVHVDGKQRSTYWCDDLGTVYRAELGDQHLAMELVRVRELPGRILWPAGAAP